MMNIPLKSKHREKRNVLERKENRLRENLGRFLMEREEFGQVASLPKK